MELYYPLGLMLRGKNSISSVLNATNSGLPASIASNPNYLSTAFFGCSTGFFFTLIVFQKFFSVLLCNVFAVKMIPFNVRPGHVYDITGFCQKASVKPDI